jgi:hypothetical protein
MSFDSITATDVHAEWRTEAACNSITNGGAAILDSALVDLEAAWINENHPARRHAENICATKCPVRFLCGLDAAQDPESEGLRAGFYFSNGRVPHAEARQMKHILGIDPKTRQRTRISKKAS